MGETAVMRVLRPVLGQAAALVAVWGAFAVAIKLRTGDPWIFASWWNQSLILAQAAIVIVLAAGATPVVITAGIDLSVGAVLALCSVVCAQVLAAGYDPWLAALAALAVGTLCGAANGVLIAYGRLLPFIVTLGMLGAARGLAKLLAGNQAVNFRATWLDHLMQPHPAPDAPLIAGVLGVAPGFALAMALAAAVALLLARTVAGRAIYAIGSNEAAARLCGIRVGATKLAVYTLAGAIAGIAGVLETAKLHQGDPVTAMGRELDVIAAVVIGGVSLTGGSGTMLGAVLGALLMAVLRSGSNQIGWSNALQDMAIGGVIVLAAGLDRWRQRRAAT